MSVKESVTGEGEPHRGREPSVQELESLATHAEQRVALYRRRMLLGRGEQRRFDELQRVASGAVARLGRARDRAKAAER
jgi:hypothetical protein